MLPTFVIGLREGLEAALIVGIVAAFLRTNGRRGDVRRMWLGVGAAVLLCIAVGIGLQQLSDGLPQRQQEMLECVIAAVAVVMVTFMILWMRKHSRSMRSSLEGAASSALAKGSAWALVGMAFLAVLREGFETSVFLLAALQNSASGVAPLLGAILGLAVALVMGWGIYRGALRFNMAKFFTITSVFLVLVAAGLVMKTFRAAYEAGWLAIGQQSTFDLTGVISRGSIGDAVLGGVFGIQAQPALIEVLAWLAYAIPMLVIVLLPRRFAANPVTQRRTLIGAAAACAAIAVAGLILAPSPDRADDSDAVAVSALSPDKATVVLDGTTHELTAADHVTIDGVDCVRYEASSSAPSTSSGDASTLTGEQIKTLRGRYPVGITDLDANTAFPATYADTTTTTVAIDPRSHEVLDYETATDHVATVTLATGSQVKAGTIDQDVTGISKNSAAAAADRAHEFSNDATSHEIWTNVVPLILMTLALILAAFWLAAGRRRTPDPTPVTKPEPALSGAGS